MCRLISLTLYDVTCSLTENAMPQLVKFPIAVALSEKFLWEVMLTNTWDHLFLGDENTGLPVLPREISFCPTERSWCEATNGGKIIYYSEPSTHSIVTVGMRKETVDDVSLWYPDHIYFHIEVVDTRLHKKTGSRLVTPSFSVWHKD